MNVSCSYLAWSYCRFLTTVVFQAQYPENGNYERLETWNGIKLLTFFFFFFTIELANTWLEIWFFCFCHETDFQNVARCACLTTQVWGAGNVMFDLDLCSQGSVCFWSRMLLWRYLLRCYAATLLHPSALPKKNKSMNKTPPGHIRFFPSVYTHQ